MRIACINYQPITLYKDQGWSCERLSNYYNPSNVASNVKIFAYNDCDWVISPNVEVCGYQRFSELSRKCSEYKPDIIRCYEAFHPYSDYALILSLQLNIPSYLSLHDARVVYHPRLAAFSMITAYTENLARKASLSLGREVEVQHNGIDSHIFRPKEPSYIDQRVLNAKYRIFTVGRNDPVKNISTAMEATTILSKQLPSVCHVLAGPGTEAIKYDGVHMGLGSTTEHLIAEYLNWSCCFLQVQTVTDLGMAACEALMCGRPVVVTGDTSGNAQYYINEDKGILIPLAKAKDAHHIATGLQHCLINTYDSNKIANWASGIFDAEMTRHQEANRYITTVFSKHQQHLSNVHNLLMFMRLELMTRDIREAILSLVSQNITKSWRRWLDRIWNKLAHA
jgi:glycosyltransferase involved in cell wall biosynthesis